MIDQNEVFGFVAGCKNPDALKNLRNAVEDRLRQLGASCERREPKPFTFGSVKEAVKKDLGL